MRKTMLALMAIMVSILALGTVFAYQNGNRENTNSAIDKIAAENAVESGDYAAWKALHVNSNGKMVSLINEDNFYLLKEIHNAREAGDFAKVQEIKTELGFKSGNGQGKGMHLRQDKNGNIRNCPYAN